MITLYGGPTPNARKVAILLEELGQPWDYVFVDIVAGDQLKPDFLALNPNNKMPVIVDDAGPDGRPFVLWESGAILWHLAEQAGRFIPADVRGRATCHQWLMFQMSGVGPMFGQNAHFVFYAKDKHPYALERYGNEVTRILGVLDRRLADSPYIAGDDYTVADIATYPYTLRASTTRRDEFPHLARWADGLAARPAVQAGMEVGRQHVRKETVEGGMQGLTDEHRSVLFGERQYARR